VHRRSSGLWIRQNRPRRVKDVCVGLAWWGPGCVLLVYVLYMGEGMCCSIFRDSTFAVITGHVMQGNQ
jgi:hypothetical protein